jgi:hypothetical protein
VLILLAVVAFWLGFVSSAFAWLFIHTLGIPFKAGWNLWAL